jgi:aminopeptidase
MYEPNLERVAYKMIRDVLRVQPGEHVIVEVRSDAVPFAEQVAIEVFRVGGTCTLFLTSDELQYIEATEAEAEQLSRPTEARLAAIESCHHYITIGRAPAEPTRFYDTDPERENALRHRQNTLNSVLVQPGRKWLSTEFPTRYMAEAIRMPWARFNEIYWRAADVDYGALAGRATAIAEILEKAREIRLTTPRGTDLYLRRGNRPILRDDGYIRTVGSLPAGEVYFAPLEESVTGRVVFDFVSHSGQRIADLDIVFENGIGTPLGAASNYELFLRHWENATGDKNRVGELGIGLNEELRAPLGYPLLDEKVFGSVHLALGDNTIMGGNNHSTLHWDMILARPTLIADERLILQNGQFVDL